MGSVPIRNSTHNNIRSNIRSNTKRIRTQGRQDNRFNLAQLSVHLNPDNIRTLFRQQALRRLTQDTMGHRRLRRLANPLPFWGVRQMAFILTHFDFLFQLAECVNLCNWSHTLCENAGYRFICARAG